MPFAIATVATAGSAVPTKGNSSILYGVNKVVHILILALSARWQKFKINESLTVLTSSEKYLNGPTQEIHHAGWEKRKYSTRLNDAKI